METKYTGIETESHLVIHSVRSDLTPALSKYKRTLHIPKVLTAIARLNPIVRQEVDTCVEKYLPDCKDWTEVTIYKTIVDIVAQVSGRVFIGAGLCEDPQYLDCATNYTLDLVNSVTAIKRLRPWLRPFMAPRLPEVRRLRQREKDLAAFLYPLIEQRREAAKNPDWEKPDDMTQWMLDRSAGDRISVEKLATCQLGLIFAAIHTTSLTATNIFYTLATTPQYIDPLREEIRSVLAEHNGAITTKALQQMEKLDSYMKEVNRFYPPGMSKSFAQLNSSPHTNTISVLWPQSPQRHHSLQRPIHSARCPNRSALPSHLQRLHPVAVERHIRRPAALQAAARRQLNGPRAQPIRDDQRAEPGLWVWTTCLSRSVLRCQ